MTLAAKISAWEAIVAQVAAGYRLGLDDWLNDMDLRRGIDDGLAALSAARRADHAADLKRLAAADARFRRATVATVTCLWGSNVAAREGWRAERQWWYFRKPRRDNEELHREIAKVE